MESKKFYIVLVRRPSDTKFHPQTGGTVHSCLDRAKDAAKLALKPFPADGSVSAVAEIIHTFQTPTPEVTEVSLDKALPA